MLIQIDLNNSVYSCLSGVMALTVVFIENHSTRMLHSKHKIRFDKIDISGMQCVRVRLWAKFFLLQLINLVMRLVGKL